MNQIALMENIQHNAATLLAEQGFSDVGKIDRALSAFVLAQIQVDLHAASMRGILVFNAPFSNVRSVA